MITFLHVVRILLSGLIDVVAILVFFFVYSGATTEREPAYEGEKIHMLNVDAFWSSPLPYVIISLFLLSLIASFFLQRYVRKRGFGIGFRTLLSLLGNSIRITLAVFWGFAVQMDGSLDALFEVVFGLVIVFLWAALQWFYYGRVMRSRILKDFEEALQVLNEKHTPSESLPAVEAPDGYSQLAEGSWGSPAVNLSVWIKTEKTNYYDLDYSHSIPLAKIATTEWMLCLQGKRSASKIPASNSQDMSPEELSSHLTGGELSSWKKLSSRFSIERLSLSPQGFALYWKPPYAVSYLGVRLPDQSEMEELSRFSEKALGSV